jgi:protein tyrosine phosphatase
VALEPEDGISENDYINASYVDVSDQKREMFGKSDEN